jgi:hypothetical protein
MDSPEGCLFFACILWECAGCKEAVPDFSAAPCHTVATHFQWRGTVNALELPDVHGRGVVLSLESHAKCRLVGNINADLIALEKRIHWKTMHCPSPASVTIFQRDYQVEFMLFSREPYS